METIKCGECGHAIEEDHGDSVADRIPCTACGSIKRSFEICLKEGVSLGEKLGMKAKHGKSGKPFFESVVGADMHRASGQYMHLERTIDREHDLYEEEITDPKTGQIVRHCKEKLSQHRGHGSAKCKPKNDS